MNNDLERGEVALCHARARLLAVLDAGLKKAEHKQRLLDWGTHAQGGFIQSRDAIIIMAEVYDKTHADMAAYLLHADLVNHDCLGIGRYWTLSTVKVWAANVMRLRPPKVRAYACQPSISVVMQPQTMQQQDKATDELQSLRRELDNLKRELADMRQKRDYWQGQYVQITAELAAIRAPAPETTQAITDDKPLATQGRNSALVIMAALAKQAKIDWGHPSKAGTAVAAAVAELGCPLTERAAAKWMSEIPAALRSRAK